MKKHITLLFLLIALTSYGQIRIQTGDRQKITEFEKRNDSLVISLENSGTNKVYIGDIAGVALGETSITAYRGDRGKTAYDHTSLSNNPHAVTKSQVGLGNVDNTSDLNKPVSTLTQTALNDKANINSPTFTGNVIVPTATISDAAVNLGQMMDSLATVGTGLIQEIASTKTLTKEDAWKIFRNRSVGDSVTYTIPNQANGGFTEDIGYTFYTKTTGKIFVKGEPVSGVEPVEISGVGQYATITRMGENTWDWSKGVLPWDPNAVPSLYTTLNAANPYTEEDSTTGFSTTDAITFSTSTALKTSGVYSVNATTSGTGVMMYIDRPSTLEAGGRYVISMDIAVTGSILFSLSTNTGNQWASTVSVPIDLTDGNFKNYTINGELSSITNAESGRLGIYIDNFSSATTNVYIDNIVWEEDPYGPELYTNSNALGSINNANSVTGLDAISGTTQSSVANTSPASTSFAWEIVSTSIHEDSRGREILAVDNATGTYEVKFWARQSVGSGSGGARFRMQQVVNTSHTEITDQWVYYEFEITVTSINPQIEFFTNRSAGVTAVGSIGDAVQVTGFSIKLKL